MTTNTWGPRPVQAVAVRAANLKRNLIAIFATVQASFVAFVIGINVAAETQKTGEGFNDLGVMIGKQVVLNEVYGWWLLSGVALAVAFVTVYFVEKERWAR